MVPHCWTISDSKACPRIAGRSPAFDEFLKIGIVGRNVDLDGDQLVAALAVLGGETAALEPQDLARRRSLRNGKHDRPIGRRNFHLGAEHRLLESHRKLEANVGAVTRVETVRGELDRDERVPAAARSVLALASEADSSAVLEAGWKLEVDGLAVGERNPLRLKCHCVLERDLEAVRDIGALLRRPATLPKAAERPTAAPAGRSTEQALEQVAQVGGVAGFEVEVFEPTTRLRSSRA